MNLSEQLILQHKRLTEARKAKKPEFIGETGDGFYAVRLDGFTVNCFRDQVEHKREIAEFKRTAKKGYVNTKRKSYESGVKKWIKEHKPEFFYAYLPERNGEEADSIEIYYTGGDEE